MQVHPSVPDGGSLTEYLLGQHFGVLVKLTGASSSICLHCSASGRWNDLRISTFKTKAYSFCDRKHRGFIYHFSMVPCDTVI